MPAFGPVRQPCRAAEFRLPGRAARPRYAPPLSARLRHRPSPRAPATLSLRVSRTLVRVPFVFSVVCVDYHHVLWSCRLRVGTAGEYQICQRQRSEVFLLAPGSVGQVSVSSCDQCFERLTHPGVESNTVGGSNRPSVPIPLIHPRAQTRRPPLTFQDVQTVGGLQAAGFVTHSPRELRLSGSSATSTNASTRPSSSSRRVRPGLSGTGDRIHLTRRHHTTIQRRRDHLRLLQRLRPLHHAGYLTDRTLRLLSDRLLRELHHRRQPLEPYPSPKHPPSLSTPAVPPALSSPLPDPHHRPRGQRRCAPPDRQLPCSPLFRTDRVCPPCQWGCQ